jgi:uncharacterized protein (DUF433 family)
MDWLGCELIEVIPGKVSGVPLIRHTRVPVDLVIASKDGGETVEEIAYSYDLKPEEVRAVLLYRDSLELVADWLGWARGRRYGNS